MKKTSKNNDIIDYFVTPTLKLKLNPTGQWQGGVSSSAGDYCFSGELLALFEILGTNKLNKEQRSFATFAQLADKLKKQLRSNLEKSPNSAELPELLEELCAVGILCKSSQTNELSTEKISGLSGIADGFGDPWTQWAMVSDSFRCDAYERSIAKAIKALAKSKQKNAGNSKINVLDIGCGKGYLSAASFLHGAQNVWALEETQAAQGVPSLLKKLGMPHAAPRFTLECAHSSACKLPNVLGMQIDLVVSELFGNDPFQEGMIPTLRDVFDRLLPEKPSAIPSSVELFFEFCELVQTPASHRIAALYKTLLETSVHQVNATPTRGSSALLQSSAPKLQTEFLRAFLKTESMEDLSFPMALRAEQIAQRSRAMSLNKCTLNPPGKDPFKDQTHEILLPHSLLADLKIGKVWVGIVWFRAELWPGHTLSNHPQEPDGCEHWSPIVLPFTKLNMAKSKKTVAQIKCGLNHEENRVWVELTSQNCGLSRKP